jgi:hypothetical protein
MAGELRVNLILETAKAMAELKAFLSGANTGSARSGGKSMGKAMGDGMAEEIKSKVGLTMELMIRQWNSPSNPLMAAFKTRTAGQMGNLFTGSALNKQFSEKSELQKQLEKWRAENPGGIAPGQQVSIMGDNPNADKNREAHEMFRNRSMSGGGLATMPPNINESNKYKGATPPLIADVERERLKKMGLGVITAMFNPWIGSRLLSDAVASGGSGGGRGGSATRGIFGAGGAFGFAEFYIAITAIKKAIRLIVKGLEWGAEQIKKAIEFSHQLYAKSLESGLNLRFTAQRQMAANALGVDEKDIFRFAQSGAVMRQLSDAANTLSKNAPQLAYAATQFKILEFNILASGSNIAVKLAPAFNTLSVALEVLLTRLNATVNNVQKLAIAELIAQTPLIGLKNVMAMIKLFSVNGQQTLGQPQSFMKQLPVGAFEKMGLIIGGGMADKALEYQRRAATGIEKLVQATTKVAGNKGQSWYMNRNPGVAGH